ncbi:hypothetical protein MHZ92_19900 [Sporosarcina sp. ACRSL]|uniref:hypothetical protein n=1 Tax=Sporosarcina sp. ACRSL TaxID=2918215 RepID=UPI001EF66AE4|nr:hypothetical protein [Sporosarcina sp. ACRSL]MCG7346372.1 hypothetical protein [Sporosarcina sp. ACRSL]
MKSKISLAILTTILIGGILFFTTYFAYEESDEFYNFPIPKNAQLLSGNENVAIYNWSKATEENGIPFVYEIIIKSKGWRNVGREGASTYYEKEGHIIDLISQTDELTIIAK